MADYAAKPKELLHANQCRFERQGKGDHEIWFSPIMEVRFSRGQQNQIAPYRKRRPETGWPTQAVLIGSAAAQNHFMTVYLRYAPERSFYQLLAVK